MGQRLPGSQVHQLLEKRGSEYRKNGPFRLELKMEDHRLLLALRRNRDPKVALRNLEVHTMKEPKKIKDGLMMMLAWWLMSMDPPLPRLLRLTLTATRSKIIWKERPASLMGKSKRTPSLWGHQTTRSCWWNLSLVDVLQPCTSLTQAASRCSDRLISQG